MELPAVGIWDQRLRFGDEDEISESAAELEELGYGALWIPDIGGDIFASLNLLLWATRRIVVGTGVLNLWMQDAVESAARWHRLVRDHAGLPALGIGVSHAPLVDALLPGQYKSRLVATAAYLDELDVANPPVPADDRLLAALRPRMLELARDRCAGAFPYHMPRTPSYLGRGKRPTIWLPKMAVAPRSSFRPDEKTTWWASSSFFSRSSVWSKPPSGEPR